MKHKLFLAGLVFAIASTWLTAQQATVLRLIGASSVEVITMDSDTPQSFAQGEVIPEGALVTVPEGAKMFLRTFAGTITTVEGGSTIFIEQVETTTAGKEVTRIELKSGDLVAVLDPAKRDVNDYGVRTPKGVAAARGTNFTVNVSGVGVTMNVTGGSVVFELPAGGSIDFTAGEVLLPGSDVPIPLSEAISNPTVRNSIRAASSALAQVAADPEGTGVSATAATSALSTVITAVGETGDADALAEAAATAAVANPALATSVVETASASNPAAAAAVVATTGEAWGPESGVSTEDLINAANEGTQEATTGNNPPQTIDVEDVDSADDVEVPTDEIEVIRTTEFGIQLSGGRIAVVSLNSGDAAVTVRLDNSFTGPITPEQGNGGEVAFTIPPEVAETLNEAVSSEQFQAIADALETLLGIPEITVPNNTIVVSPSS